MRIHIARGVLYGLGVLTLVVAAQRALFATAPLSAPEIDGSAVSAGVAVIAAGVLIARSRMQSK